MQTLAHGVPRTPWHCTVWVHPFVLVYVMGAGICKLKETVMTLLTIDQCTVLKTGTASYLPVVQPLSKVEFHLSIPTLAYLRGRKWLSPQVEAVTQNKDQEEKRYRKLITWGKEEKNEMNDYFCFPWAQQTLLYGSWQVPRRKSS